MELRAHQREALARILAAVAAGERRMTVASACGSGKTLTAQRAARHLAPNGTVLVLVPTKALLVQTARRWRQSGQPGMALGVCSLSQRASGLDPGAALMVRHPRAIARAMRTGGPVTVFATYSSLHHIRRAHEGFQLPAWDLVIADEAHRTCTAFGDGWGTVHDDAALPAKLRLYMTATPRVWGAPAEDEDIPFVQRPPLATMDRREIFGPTVYELGMAAAIEMGILADYQVLLPVVADADLFGILTTPRPGTTAHLDGLRNGAIQVAVLRAIAEHGLRRVLVFHNRVAAAEAFATPGRSFCRATVKVPSAPTRRMARRGGDGGGGSGVVATRAPASPARRWCGIGAGRVLTRSPAWMTYIMLPSKRRVTRLPISSEPRATGVCPSETMLSLDALRSTSTTVVDVRGLSALMPPRGSGPPTRPPRTISH